MNSNMHGPNALNFILGNVLPELWFACFCSFVTELPKVQDKVS